MKFDFPEVKNDINALSLLLLSFSIALFVKKGSQNRVEKNSNSKK